VFFLGLLNCPYGTFALSREKLLCSYPGRRAWPSTNSQTLAVHMQQCEATKGVKARLQRFTLNTNGGEALLHKEWLSETATPSAVSVRAGQQVGVVNLAGKAVQAPLERWLLPQHCHMSLVVGSTYSHSPPTGQCRHLCQPEGVDLVLEPTILSPLPPLDQANTPGQIFLAPNASIT
jgi:hypothetical protein